MKKIIFSILSVGMLFASCAKFDEPTDKVFGDGPSIEVSQPVVADSTFTFTVTPGANTNYYTYAVVKSDKIEDVDAEALLKNQIECVCSGVQDADDVKTVTETMNKNGENLAEPNTAYVIYAVAADGNGIPGTVKAVQVKTTDGTCPQYDLTTVAVTDTSFVLPFNENIVRGEGKVTAQYFVEYGDEQFVDVDSANISVSVSGNAVTFSAAKVPANCYVLFSFETGAFVDNAGNKCNSLSSGLNEDETDFAGIYYQTAAKYVDITMEDLSDPVAGKIKDWTKAIVLDFGQPIFASDFMASTIKVIYTNDKKTTQFTLDEWTIEGNTLSFNLPEEPANGDEISFIFEMGVFMDIYGNPNEETALEDVYKYDPTKWNLVGVGTYTYFPFFGNEDGSGYPSEQALYVNAENPSQFMFTDWGGGFDFVFNVASDGTITWDPFKCYYYNGYGWVQAYDVHSFGDNYPRSYYDSVTGTYHFQIDYYLEAAEYDWYDFDNDETFVLNASSSKARRSAAKLTKVKSSKNIKAKSVKSRKASLRK